MRVRIMTEGFTDDGELRSLHQWLSRDAAAEGGAAPGLVSRAEDPGRMGPLLEAIEAVFGNAMELGSLVVAVATWRATRPRRGQVMFEYEGVKVTLEDDDPEAVRRVQRMLDGLVDPRADREDDGTGEETGPDRRA